MIQKNIRFYLSIAFFAFIGILYVWSKFLPAPSNPQHNNSVQVANGNQQAQAGTTDQNTVNLESTIIKELKNTPIKVDTGTSELSSIHIGDLLQQVIVTKDQNGAFDVVVNFNIVKSSFGSTAELQQADGIMSAIYVVIYKNNPNANINNVTAAAYQYGPDNYGNQKDILQETSSLGKSEASNYNWSLNDGSLINLIHRNLRSVQPR